MPKWKSLLPVRQAQTTLCLRCVKACSYCESSSDVVVDLLGVEPRPLAVPLSAFVATATYQAQVR